MLPKSCRLFNGSERYVAYHSECYKAVTNKSYLNRLKSKHGGLPNLDIILTQQSDNGKNISETSTFSKKTS